MHNNSPIIYIIAMATKKNITRRRIFTEEDYKSGDGMLTKIWGPCMWHFLHTMSFNYPVKPDARQKVEYMKFVKNLQNILPCGKCRENLHLNFKKLPLRMTDMKSRATFSRYIYNLHELVNTMLGKKSGLSYEDIRERYEHFRARCVTPQQMNLKKCLPLVNKTIRKSEKGCIQPLYGKKSKCVLKIVPDDVKCKTLEIAQS